MNSVEQKEREKKKKKQLGPCYKQWSPQAGGCSELYGAYFSQPQLDWNNLLDVSIERQRLWMTEWLMEEKRQPSFLPPSKHLILPLGKGRHFVLLHFVSLAQVKWCNAWDPKGKTSLQIRYSAYCWNYCMGYFWFIQRSVPFHEQGAIRYSPGQTKR